MGDVFITPIHEILEKLFTKTLVACEKAGAIKDVTTLRLKLMEEGLGPKDIEAECATELRNMCAYEYEEAVGGSDRNQGKGYSSMKIEQHMKAFLKQKLKKFAVLLSNNEIEEKEIKKSFEEIMHEI